MTALNVLQRFFEARDQVHYLHLETFSFSEHKALNTFYEEWLDLLDSFTETYQGKYGRISGAISIKIDSNVDARKYLIDLQIFLNEYAEPIVSEADSDLCNILADMKGLVNHTLYMLTLK